MEDRVKEFVQRRMERVEQKKQERMDAYRTVYDDLISIPMFAGRYDSRNGKEDYMYGIETVMERIAYCAGGDELSDVFSTTFVNNMRYSKERDSYKSMLKKAAVIVGSVAAVGSAVVVGCKALKGRE